MIARVATGVAIALCAVFAAILGGGWTREPEVTVGAPAVYTTPSEPPAPPSPSALAPSALETTEAATDDPDDPDDAGIGSRASRAPLRPIAEAGAVLSSRGCGDLLATEPETLATSRIDVGEACSGEWTPEGDVLASEPALTGEQELVLLDRDGSRLALGVSGRDVQRPVAFGRDGRFVACAVSRRGGRSALYERRGRALMLWRSAACHPASAGDGTLAWASAPDDGETAGDGQRFRTVTIREPGQADRELARFTDTWIEALAWTGDGNQLVAVVARDSLRRVVTIGRDGFVRTLIGVGSSVAGQAPATRAVVAPVGSHVLVLLDDRERALVFDTQDGRVPWIRRLNGAIDAAWSPRGDRVLLVDRRGWTVVAAADGDVQRRTAPLGRAPSWCCPSLRT